MPVFDTWNTRGAGRYPRLSRITHFWMNDKSSMIGAPPQPYSEARNMVDGQSYRNSRGMEPVRRHNYIISNAFAERHAIAKKMGAAAMSPVAPREEREKRSPL